MITDKQVQKLLRLLADGVTDGVTLARAAWRTDMDAKTAGKYRRPGKRPSEIAVPHTWQTRPNPIAEVWQAVCELLQANPGLQVKTIFQELQRRHPGQFADNYRH